jgi:hypothetical protein
MNGSECRVSTISDVASRRIETVVRGLRGLWPSVSAVPLTLTLTCALVVSTTACGAKQGSGPPVGISDKPGDTFVPSDRPVTFLFDSLDERPVSSAATRGKPTVLAFIATGDLLGQAQIDYLVAMAKNDHGAVNYAMVALHPRKEIVLVEAYAKTLNVEFPVALGDSSSLSTGPFGDIPAVPTVVVLSRDGRLVWKHTGLAKSEELRSHLSGL